MIGTVIGLTGFVVILCTIGTIGYWYWKLKKADEKLNDAKIQKEVNEYKETRKEVQDAREEKYNKIRKRRKSRLKEGRIGSREQPVKSDSTGKEKHRYNGRPSSIPIQTNKNSREDSRESEETWPEFE